VILDDSLETANQSVDSTLDDLFRAAAARRPRAIALIDPPDRNRFTDGPARRLTYAEADRIISGIAARLRRAGLQGDAVVALQMANTVDGVLALLGVLRAELIAMPLPLLWRRADMVGALRRTGASALVVSGRIGATDHFDLAINAAAEAFTVRQVCGFGPRPPDGAIALDDIYTAAEVPSGSPASLRAVSHGRGAHVAALTWDVGASGPVPVARSNAQLIAGGLAVLLESGIPPDATILSTFAPTTFAGIAMSLVPWLMVGGTLALHHPFDAASLAEQGHDCDTVIVPGPLVSALKAAGILATPNAPQNIVAAWRAPELLRRAADWRDSSAMTDVQLFGEIGLLAARRRPDGRPVPIPLGGVRAPRAAEGGLLVAEAAVDGKGALSLSGPMVPMAAFPPGAERTALPCHRPTAEGFLDTGYTCDTRQGGSAVVVVGSAPDVISIGGYRFAVSELKHTINSLDPSGTLAVRPDSLLGHRLSGTATNPEAIQMSLRAIGANPLLLEAFGGRAEAGPVEMIEERRRIA
jgi:AMP-binding enzyme